MLEVEIGGADGVPNSVKLLLVEELESGAVTPMQSKPVQP